MAKNYSKAVYSLYEIRDILMQRNPGFYKQPHSAYEAVRRTAERLGCEDVNGKKKYRQISARDAEKVLAECEAFIHKKDRRPEQATIFDFSGVDWIEPEEQKEAETPPVPAMDQITEEQAEAIANFFEAWRRLAEAYGHTGEVI